MLAIRSAFAVLLLTAVAAIASFQQPKKPEPKPAAEIEKLMLAVPGDVTQGEWIKEWRERVIISFAQEVSDIGSDVVVRFSLENKSPCAIKVTSDLSMLKWADRLAGLTTDGKPAKKAAKSDPDKPSTESWTVEPGKKLVISKRPAVANRVMEVPLKNDFNTKKASFFVLRVGPLCGISLIPNEKDAKPLDLILVTRSGANGTKVAVSDYHLCPAGDAKDFIEKFSKLR